MRSAELETMNTADLKTRTRQFALRVIRMSEALPRKMAADVIGRQLVRSATSVAGNYRSACRGRSRADFIAKMGVVEEEADESALWLELLEESGMLSARRLAALQREAGELTAIAVSSIRTARSGGRNPQSAVRNPQ
jgi:four helix bundle protein